MKDIIDRIMVIVTIMATGLMFSLLAGMLPTIALKFIFPTSIFFYGTVALLTSTVIGAIILATVYTIYFKE